MKQSEALEILKAGTNVFLTGEPGSGKTHTVNQYVSWLRSHGIEPAITASTGIAATHIGGMTIHSWSGIGVRREMSPYDLDTISQNKRVATRIVDAKVLIIDEVSMLSASTLTMVDQVCREIRADARPFGGLQTVLVGDFFQLPPVTRREEAGPERSDLDGPQEVGPRSWSDLDHDSVFAFTSPAWQELNPLVCYLTEQHRQEDAVFLDFLSAIRRGSVTEQHRALLRTRAVGEPEDGMTQLYSHNADVDAINDAELLKLPGDVKTFMASHKGPEHLVAALQRGCLSPDVLALKIGAKVMFTKNDIMRQAYVNGTLGTLTGFDKEHGFPLIRTNTGRRIVAEPVDWNLEDSGRLLASITQVPLRLAWAMTVHKSQGMSLDAAHMDLSQAFEYGQGYVALSRVRTLEGLSLEGLNERSLQVHPEILEQDGAFRERSAQVREVFSGMPPGKRKALQEQFILSCGGSLRSDSGGARDRTSVGRKRSDLDHGSRSRRLPTHHITKQLLAKGLSLEDMAKERGLAPQTILTHLEKLAEEETINPESDCAHLLDRNGEALADVHEAFRALGTRPLKPVFEQLGGSVPCARCSSK